MKLALLGAGGTRAPLFVESLARRAPELGGVELLLHDTDPDRLRLLGGLARAFGRDAAGALGARLVDRLDEAVDAARYVVTSIRAGGDHGRVLDERIALERGVIGQETVGAGGFAMAARSAAALAEIAKQVEQRGDGAWTLHFTNPAGLVTQILTDAGYERQIGVCDSPSDLLRRVAAHLGAPLARLGAHVVGLNHLSWIVRLEGENGEDRLPALLADRGLLGAVAPGFDARRIAATGALPGEYLHYYEHATEVLERQLAQEDVRAERIEAANRSLLEDLARIDPTGRFERGLEEARERYGRYVAERDESYRAQIGRERDEPPPDASEGYAGIALEIIAGLEVKPSATGPWHRSVLSTRNGGAVPWLRDDDVIETTVVLDRDGPRPVPAPPLHEDIRNRIEAVKRYERLASSAIRSGSPEEAARALAAHPLVRDGEAAEALASAYLDAHAAHLPGFAGRSPVSLDPTPTG